MLVEKFLEYVAIQCARTDQQLSGILMKYRGEFEGRARQLIDEIGAKQDELIAFIDELHTIVGAGQGGGEGGLS